MTSAVDQDEDADARISEVYLDYLDYQDYWLGRVIVFMGKL